MARINTVGRSRTCMVRENPREAQVLKGCLSGSVAGGPRSTSTASAVRPPRGAASDASRPRNETVRGVVKCGTGRSRASESARSFEFCGLSALIDQLIDWAGTLGVGALPVGWGPCTVCGLCVLVFVEVGLLSLILREEGRCLCVVIPDNTLRVQSTQRGGVHTALIKVNTLKP